MSEPDRKKPLKEQVLDEPRDMALHTRGVLMIEEARTGGGTAGLEDVLPRSERDAAARRAYENLPQPPLTVWANHAEIPISVCFDARLRGRPRTLEYPQGPTFGQTGWDLGLEFHSIKDLADQLSGPLEVPGHICGKTSTKCLIRTGKITRLALNMHGLPGQIFINGKEKEPLTTDNIDSFQSELRQIWSSTDKESTILLMGCVAGLMSDGSRLLETLSKRWPARKVVGFPTLGYAWGARMSRPGTTGSCSEAGMRLTWSHSASLDRKLEAEFRAEWDNLNKLPWASENHKWAKVSYGGRIVKGGDI